MLGGESQTTGEQSCEIYKDASGVVLLSNTRGNETVENWKRKKERPEPQECIKRSRRSKSQEKKVLGRSVERGRNGENSSLFLLSLSSSEWRKGWEEKRSGKRAWGIERDMRETSSHFPRSGMKRTPMACGRLCRTKPDRDRE